MANHHPSPPVAMQMHHGPPGAPPLPPQQQQQQQWPSSRAILQMNELVWCGIGRFSELLGNLDEAIAAYERALVANNQSIPAMNAISMILRAREDFPKAAEYLQAILKLDANHGEAWGSLGHCYLMMDDLQQAYAAYQNAVVNLNSPKDPKLWYGIGILYDRYGSLDHAEDAFSQVMQMEPGFEKAHEIYFRLGIIYKQQTKFQQSLECFNYIVHAPPPPLTQEDIWFQIGHVHEQQKDFENAKAAYLKVLERDPNHAKVLQQLGWLYHQANNSFESQDRAIDYLEKSVAADNQDAQSWYLLGRCYMGQQKYPKAYEAYQQAVYRDGRNPTFWCSIGVLYYQINQYRDALDAYSRAIRLNPFISEVWYDLGTLYESCNNQINDALDAYQRAAELDPGNPHIKARLQLLQSGQNGGPTHQAPMPTDVHPQAYQSSSVVGPPGPQWAGSAPQHPQPHAGPPPGPGPNWGRINDINAPPQPPNPYPSDREQFRGPTAQPMPRQPSPRAEQQLRPYPEPGRGPGMEPMRRASPPPPAHYSLPPQQQQQPPPPPPPPQAGPVRQAPPQPPSSQVPPVRVLNPTSWGQAPHVNPQQPQGPNGGPPPPPPPPHHGLHGPYRTSSPMSNGRPPMNENRMPSPKSAYPQHQPPYPPHADHPGPSGPESGLAHAPPPPGMSNESLIHRDHDHRPPSAPPKRLRDWEDEREPKKAASDENRARMEDTRHRRPSTPPRERESYRRHSSEARRFDEQRRMEEQRRHDEQRRAEEMRRVEEMRRADEQRHAAEGYHPSEAAHHAFAHTISSHLPSMGQGPSQMQNILNDGPPAGPALKDYAAPEERARMDHAVAPNPQAATNEPERAARKMEVDEDYDDSGEEDKKVAISAGPLSGPTAATSDGKNGTQSGAGMNGMIGPKVEGT